MEKPSHCQFLVAGAGMAGICAALQAGRLGMETILVEKEWSLGGNSGPLMGIPWSGALRHNEGWHETGIVEELNERLYQAGIFVRAGKESINLDPLVDTLISDLLEKAGVTILRRHAVIAAYTVPGHDKGLTRVHAVEILNLENLERFVIEVNGFALDATGDAALAASAGADTRMGRESRTETGERSAPEEADTVVSAASITALVFDVGYPCPFTPPPGTPKWNPDKPANTFDPTRRQNILFQVDEGGGSPANHPLYSPQQVYRNLRRDLFSMWDYMKNVLEPERGLTHKLIWISPLLGRRESRRIVGDYVLTQTDIEATRAFPDAIGMSGGPLDYHPPSPDGGYECIFYSAPPPCSLPLRMLYSRNVENLFAGGRCVSATHVAFTATRLIRVGGQLGQVAALAAALCTDKGTLPRCLTDEDVAELQTLIQHHDGFIPETPILNPDDIAASATVTASSMATFSREPADPSAQTRSWASARQGLGAAIYCYPDRLEKVAFWVRNTTGQAQSVRIQVGYGETPQVAWPEVRERRPNEPYRFSPSQRPTIKFRVWQEQAAVAAPGEGWVAAHIQLPSVLPPFDRSRFKQALLITVAGDVELLAAPHGLDVVDAAHCGESGWQATTGAVPVFRLSPEPPVAAASNALDGMISREGLGHLHAWISQPGQPLPQTLTLDLGSERTFDEIRLHFATTERFYEDAFFANYQPAARRCVADYAIEIETPAGWQRVLTERDNYRRFRVHTLAAPVAARRLRFVVERMQGEGEPAALSAIRLFDTTA